MNFHMASGHALDKGLQSVCRPIEQAGHAPGLIYSSPEVYRQEIDEYFKKDWLYAGREEELAKPGDFMSLRLVDEPIVISRGRDGKLNAFFNMCAHRGVEVAYGSGNTRAFKCPYHGWIYDLEGRLTGAGYMKESDGFTPANCRMRPIRIETWRGNIFICFNQDTPALSEFLAEFEKDFGLLQMEKCRLGNKLHLELQCNWKFVFENLMDFYHVNVLHVNTFGGKFSWSNDDVRLKDNGGISIFYKAAPPTPGGKPLLGKMPWMNDRDYSFGCHGFITPNFTIFGRIDCVRPMIVWPVSENACYITIYHLFPEEVFSRPDIDEILQVYKEYQLTVLDEDRTMIESMQKAMRNPHYEPGRMSTLEKPLHHYLNGYIGRMFGSDASGAP
jgi:Rieske 2Fe-2S family protein